MFNVLKLKKKSHYALGDLKTQLLSFSIPSAITISEASSKSASALYAFNAIAKLVFCSKIILHNHQNP